MGEKNVPNIEISAIDVIILAVIFVFLFGFFFDSCGIGPAL